MWNAYYYQTSNISSTLLGNKIVDLSYVVGVSPIGVAPTTSSFSTEHMALMVSATTARRDEKYLSLGICCDLYQRFYGTVFSLEMTNIIALFPELSSKGLHHFIYWERMSISCNFIIRSYSARISRRCTNYMSLDRGTGVEHYLEANVL